jgi:threonine dehydrogenase-like Zn-dependent dehydrogenase
MEKGGIDRLHAFYLAIDIVRRGGTISLIGVYGGMADPLPMLTLFDRLPLDDAPQAYEMFQTKRDGAIKVLLEP